MGVRRNQAVEEAVAGAGGLVLRGAAAGGQVGWVEDGGVCVVLVHCCGVDLCFVLCCCMFWCDSLLRCWWDAIAGG